MEHDTQQEQLNTKRQKVFWLIHIILFAAFLVFFMACSVPGEVRETVAETTLSAKGFATLSSSFEGVLEENIYAKNQFVNLNGLTTRVLGINSLNERYKLANGYLAREEDSVDTTPYANQVITLNEFLADRDIPFLYIMVPTKESFYDTEFLTGYESDAREKIVPMVNALLEAGVNTLDMDAWFEENGWTMEDTFFVTDHHWKPEAGLAAARCTMENLQERGVTVYNEEYLDDSNYTITILEDWFLGSHGKRVGKYYAGVDNLSVYLPDFPTDYSFKGLKGNTSIWHYRDSPLDLSMMTYIDYFVSDPYCLYLYADNPLQIITNTEAENDQRVLVVGDSFRRTWQYFLTTEFQEVYSIDTRYYTDGTLVQYIEEIHPDIVIMCSSTNSLTDSFYNFGIEKYLDALIDTSEKTANAQYLGDAILTAQEDNANQFVLLADNLRPGLTYTLTVDSTVYEGGEDQFIQMTLQDLSNNKAVANRYFDANSETEQKWIFSLPEGSDTYAVYLYAGTKWHTAGVSAKVTDITLREGVFEE